MRSAKRFCLAAAFVMSFLAACRTSTLPDTYPPDTESIFTSSPILPAEEISSIFPSHSSYEEISFAPLASSAPEEEQTSLLFIEDPSTAEYPVATESVDTEPVDTAPVITESVEILTSASFAESISEPTPDPIPEPIPESTTLPTSTSAITPPSQSTEESPSISSAASSLVPPAEPSPLLNRGCAEEAFQLQNQILTGHGIDSLLWSEPLYEVAAQRVQQISSDYSHNGCPDWVAENILMGTNQADLAIQIWYDSPGHQRNMLAGWTYGSIANYGFYWVAIYAMVEAP